MKLSEKSHEFYLRIVPGGMIRNGTLASLLLLNLTGLLSLIYSPSAFYFYLSIIPMILGDLFGLLFIIAPYKYELLFVLYTGLFGVFSSLTCFSCSQVLMIHDLKLRDQWIPIINLLLLIISGVLMYIFHFRALYNDYYANTSSVVSFPLISIVTGIGYLSTQVFTVLFHNVNVEDISLIIALEAWSVGGLLISTCIHKYFYMLQHKKELIEKEPDLGMTKKERFRKFGSKM
ncbi:hypothetical protein JOD45_000169 [Scopulibacillus daqui]|uniref:Uncharacterized protein n=1 Tax=Scopulibacillus daqui TaxID=1469162 RepID=A0ABS2PV94_9BACL|nr:hypothetical protein [Scopulibacillus daqui]MBM7643978.1 hypothetical protein [Scopulibacillus daqui]